MLWLTGFLGLTRISLCFWAHTDLTDPTVLLCGWEISQMFCVWAGSHGFHFAFGLTRISQIPQYRFVGGKSHRCFCVWAGSHGFHFAFGLTQISQIPRYCFWAHTDLTDPTVLLCGWKISQMVLCVGGLARTESLACTEWDLTLSNE